MPGPLPLPRRLAAPNARVAGAVVIAVNHRIFAQPLRIGRAASISFSILALQGLSSTIQGRQTVRER